VASPAERYPKGTQIEQLRDLVSDCRNVLQLEVEWHKYQSSSQVFLKLRFTPIEQWVHHVAVPRDGAAETPNFSWVSTKLGYCSDFQILMETCVGQKGGCHPPSCFDPKNQPGRAAHTIAFRGWRQLGAAWGFSGRICWASNPDEWNLQVWQQMTENVNKAD
jgi:hypothetical protein